MAEPGLPMGSRILPSEAAGPLSEPLEEAEGSKASLCLLSGQAKCSQILLTPALKNLFIQSVLEPQIWELGDPKRKKERMHFTEQGC